MNIHISYMIMFMNIYVYIYLYIFMQKFLFSILSLEMLQSEIVGKW